MSQTVRMEYEWGVIDWLAGAEVGNSAELSVARVALPAGNETDLHAHDNCEESVYVVRGDVECTSGGIAVKLGQGDLAMVVRGEAHRIRNDSSEPAELLLSYSSERRDFRVVVEA